jgi:hypothetical protein
LLPTPSFPNMKQILLEMGMSLAEAKLP